MEKTDKTDPLSILVVNNMLINGFDAPVEGYHPGAINRAIKEVQAFFTDTLAR